MDLDFDDDEIKAVIDEDLMNLAESQNSPALRKRPADDSAVAAESASKRRKISDDTASKETFVKIHCLDISPTHRCIKRLALRCCGLCRAFLIPLRLTLFCGAQLQTRTSSDH